MLEPVLNHLQLQLTDGRQDWVSFAFIGVVEDLDGTLFPQFVHPLAEILESGGVWIPQPAENFRAEAGNPFVFHLRPHIQGVADGKHAGIVQADHITWIGVFHHSPILPEQLLRPRQTDRLARPGMLHGHVLLEAAAADPNKGDSVAMARIHVRLQFEHESAEPFTQGVDKAVTAGSGHRPLSHLQESVQERPHTEIGHRGPEEHGSEIPGMHRLEIQFGAGDIEQLHLLHGKVKQLGLHQLAQSRIIQMQALLTRLSAPFRTCEQHHVTAASIDHPTELLATADGPVHRPGDQLQFRFDLIEQRQRLPAGTVHLVDEGEDRDLTHATDLEQLAGLWLETLGRVLQHHGVVGCRQGSVGVLRKILVAWCVQKIDGGGVVIELKDGGGNRDASLLFKFHPVGCDLALFPARLHSTGLLDRTAIEQQLLSERRLAGIRMRNDREVAAPVHRLSDRSAGIRLRSRGAHAHRVPSIHQA